MVGWFEDPAPDEACQPCSGLPLRRRTSSASSARNRSAPPSTTGPAASPIDYDGWPLLLDAGPCPRRTHRWAVCVGTGDALTLAGTILTVVVIDAEVFGDLFGDGMPLVLSGDGTLGHLGWPPYDRLIATCGFPAIPHPWLNQVRPGGAQPLGNHTIVLADLKEFAEFRQWTQNGQALAVTVTGCDEPSQMAGCARR